MVRHFASVTPLFPTAPSAPQRVAAELAAVLPRAQLAASYEYQLSYLAGPMYVQVVRVFDGAHAPVFLLSGTYRNQQMGEKRAEPHETEMTV